MPPDETRPLIPQEPDGTVPLLRTRESAPEPEIPWPWLTGGENQDGEALPVAHWERYTLQAFVAKGGMGRVYRAWDPRLKRTIALKFLRGADPDLAERFVREAQLQAKVDHDNICKIYEVGWVQGMPYIAMPFIQGKTLQEWAPDLNREQKVKIMQKVCLAVHAAHREGLIHRDLKPQNIMVDEDESGEYRPFVMDFGLAKEQAAPGLTVAGTIMGTPHYMAPEQARGELDRLDRRTDVYSLGATLFAVLLGVPPFESDQSWEVIRKVLEEEPPLPRKLDSSLPLDLEAILLRCLEKDPDRRYPSARALADDLTRYLDGEAIEARQMDRLYRLARRARKYRWILLLSATALLAVMVFGGLWLRATWKAQTQAALASRFGQDAERMANIMRYAAVLPLHDTTPERSRVRREMDLIRQQMARLGKTLEGPALGALGRGYLALGEHQEALDHLEKALRVGFKTSETRYAFALASGKLYEQGLEELNRIENEAAREARRHELIQRYRDPALAQFQGLAGESGAPPAYLPGLIAFYESRWKEALEKAREALKQDALFYPAMALEGAIQNRLQEEAGNRGHFQQARIGIEGAMKSYEKAQAIAPGEPSHYLAQAGLLTYLVDLVMFQGGADPEIHYRKAQEITEKALKIDPGYFPIMLTRARLEAVWMQVRQSRGQEAQEPIRNFIRMADLAEKSRPQDPSALKIKGDARRFQRNLEKDPWARGRLAQEAIQAYRTALDKHPDFIPALNNLGLFYLLLGQESQASEALAFFEKATDCLERQAKLKPWDFNTWNNLGLARFFRGMLPEVQDGLSFLQKAKADFRRAAQLNPQDPFPKAYEAWALNREARKAIGPEKVKLLKEGLLAAEECTRINPQWAEGWAVLGALEMESAQDASEKEARSSLHKSQIALRKALSLNPQHTQARETLAAWEKLKTEQAKR